MTYRQHERKMYFISVVALSTLFVGMTMASIVPIAAVAQPADVNGSCSKLLVIGEDDEFGLDEQAFVLESNGRDRTRLSSLDVNQQLSNRIDYASWLADGRVLFGGRNSSRLSLGFNESQAVWLTKADGSSRRAFVGMYTGKASPNGSKFAVSAPDFQIYRTNGNLVGEQTVFRFIEDLKWSAKNNGVVFVESGQGTPSLVVADGLGQNPYRLISGAGTSTSEWHYEWSPDGSRLAWSDGTTVSVSNPDGSNSQLLGTQGANELAWSPDSSRLAWSDDVSVSVSDASGRNKQMFSNDSGEFLSWSANGEQLAWSDATSIRVANADGSNSTIIAATSQAQLFAWTPDGQKIIYYDDGSVFSVDVSDGESSLIQSGISEESRPFFSHRNFSPDGARLAWATGETFWIANSDGSQAGKYEIELDFNDDQLSQPLWSPDSAVFAMSSFYGSNKLFVSNADGSAIQLVIPDHWAYSDIVGWSPCVFEPFNEGPANDDLANAETINVPVDAIKGGNTVTLSGTTAGATSEVNEPFNFRREFRNSVWYKWTPDQTMFVELSTIGSKVASVITAYTATSLNNPTIFGTTNPLAGSSKRIRITVQAGKSYFFLVDSVDRFREGAFQLTLGQPEMELSECTIIGTDGDDVISGTSAADIICALGGDDLIYARDGHDTIFAGSGNDKVYAGSGRDLVFGEDGFDELYGGHGADMLAGGAQGDKLSGGLNKDSLIGGKGADRLIGLQGDDKLYGGQGADILYGGGGNDLLDGGPFRDRCFSGRGVDTLINC